MLKPYCDHCEKNLDDASSVYAVRDIVFHKVGTPARGAKDLHFCGFDCMAKWVKDNAEPKAIIGPAQ